MEFTKKELISSVILIAKKYNQGGNYRYLIDNDSMPTIIKNIVYEMFLNEFDRERCSSEEYLAYKAIWSASVELNNKGCIEYRV